MKIYEDLIYRGLIKDSAGTNLKDKLNNESLTFYIGTDPTAESLHLGHLSSFMISKRLKDAGHNPILLIGGGTGLIGDPRPTSERDTIVEDELFDNAKSLSKQVEKLFGFKIVNNYDWIKDINVIDFLRDYGKFFNVSYMINKDIVKKRLDNGITFCELSYMILQSLDYLYLNKTYNCTLQVAGSDQWGNITSGIELIKKKTGKEVYGFTMPLVLDKYGNKFGKSEGNALWLDENKTTPYQIYQYLVNTDDEMVISYLKIFTFLDKEKIDALEVSTKKEPEKRYAQKTLAYEVVKFVHGEEKADNARKTSEDVFNNKYDNSEMPTISIKKEVINIIDFLILINISSSKSDARRLIMQGGITINDNKITDITYEVNYKEYDLDYIVVKKGKRSYIKVVFNGETK
ncbi:MAG: tyrosine--tRNA ligase [Bacilli bacterium]